MKTPKNSVIQLNSKVLFFCKIENNDTKFFDDINHSLWEFSSNEQNYLTNHNDHPTEIMNNLISQFLGKDIISNNIDIILSDFNFGC